MKIVLIDDHPLFRSGVRNLIQTTEDLEVIGEGLQAKRRLSWPFSFSQT